MGLELLDSPVRLTWDIPDRSTGLGDVDLPAIAEGIVDAGVFFVTLHGRPLRHPAITNVLEKLSGRCQLLIDCSGSEDELRALERLPQTGCQLLLDSSGFLSETEGVDSNRLSRVVQLVRNCGFEPVITLTPLQNNLNNIIYLVEFCMQSKLPKFKLPNANIGDSFSVYSSEDLPRWQDLELFRKSWSSFAANAGSLPAMEIHDLFLWEIMTPGENQNRSEYGGCQAGNSLGHLDCHGVVHPCAAWPKPLGKMPEHSLEDIWASAERHAVCESISLTPPGCYGCKSLSVCFGGCRGLAHHLNSANGERDLMCQGPR